MSTGESYSPTFQCSINVSYLQVDAEGPLVRLKNLLLNQKTLLGIAQWVTVRNNEIFLEQYEQCFDLLDLLVWCPVNGNRICHHDGSIY